MKKHLLSLSLVALATTQAMAASSYRLEVIDGPVGLYNTTATAITSDGRLVGNITNRISQDSTSGAYKDELGIISNDQLAAMIDAGLQPNATNSTSLDKTPGGGFFGFLTNPQLTLAKAFGSGDSDLTVWSKLAKVLGNNTQVGEGSAPWQTFTFQDSDGNSVTNYARDFAVRAFVDDGTNLTAAMPSFTLPGVDSGETTSAEQLGGESFAMDTNSNWLVGQSSVALTTSGQNRFNQCNTSPLTEPVLVCLRANSVISAPRNGTYLDQATYWPLSNGVPGAPVVLGTLTTPQGDESSDQFTSSITAVNVNGLAVGSSVARRSDGTLVHQGSNSTTVTQIATLFDLNTGKAVKALTDVDDDNVIYSYAKDINDNGLVIGSMKRQDGTYPEEKFFVYNTHDDSISYPDTFYASANSTANAINDQGLVVGSADWERLPPSSSRRRHAFIYDTSTKTFTDLNNLLEFDSSLVTQDYAGDTCNARTDWVLQDAVAINNEGDIAATAVTTLRDSSGAPVLDADGNKQYVLRAVKLVPTSDTPQNCSSEQDQSYKRKGASFGFWGVLAMAGLGFWRRRHNRV